MKEDKGFADINGASIYYEAAGSGHPVVFIHGASLDTRMWEDQFHAFSKQYRVVRYDVRGFGKSPVTDEEHSHVEDLKALLDCLQISRAHLVGLSMGGRISIDFALAYPDMVSAFVAADCRPSGTRNTAALTAALERVYATARDSGIEAARKPWLEIPAYGPAMKNPMVAPRLWQMVSDYSGWHWLHRRPDHVGETPAVERLQEIKAPALIIVGELEMPEFLSEAEVMQKRIPIARKVVIEGVGHMSNMENPDRFNEAVLDFLAGL